MNINRVFVIIKRELKEKLLSKAFIISTIAFPIFFLFIGWFQYYLNEKAETAKNVIIFIENKALRDSLSQYFIKYKIENLLIKIPEEYLPPTKSLENYKNDILNDKITGILFIDNISLENKAVIYYSKYSNDQKLFNALENILNTQFIYYKFNNLSTKDLSYIKSKIEFKSYKISFDKKIDKENVGNLFVSLVLSFLLYFSLLMNGSMVMNSIVEEKANRIVEIIISSIKPLEFLTGKIIGNTLTAIIQMIIWLSPIILLQNGLLLTIPNDIILNIELGKILYFLINFLLGLLTFIGLFAAVGSIYDNPQDTQSGVWPITLLIMIPFFIAISLTTNPTSQIGYLASFLPFSSLIVMPIRMNIIEVPFYQILISLVTNIITAILIFILSAKIYKVGIMITGKKPTYKDVFNWLKI